MRCGVWAALAVFIALSFAALPSAHAAKVSERNKQKRAAEAERAGLQQKLNALKRDIQKTETARSKAAEELAKSEQAISEANRNLHELAEEQRATQSKLDQLTQQQTQLTRTVHVQQQQLAKLIKDQYIAGGDDRVKLLFSGDNPNRISRELRYLGYVSQAQAQLIETLQANLKQIEANKLNTEDAKLELDEIAQEMQAQKTVLEQEKGKRATLLANLSNKLTAQRKEAGSIARDEQRLGQLVDKLAKLIEEQQKAEAAAAERRRQQAAVRQRELEERRRAREQARVAGKTPSKTPDKATNPDAIDDDAPPKTYGRNELTPEPSVQAGGPAFASLRGRLRLPVKGDLAAKFGTRREDGPSWKGLFIRAPEGAEVKAVASGRVVFADWLRGFGNLIIVDHGSQYLTIYGYNQAVLKRAGDNVKAGDTIASAGTSGGNQYSGLYFEMRHQGRAFDPLEWVVR